MELWVRTYSNERVGKFRITIWEKCVNFTITNIEDYKKSYIKHIRGKNKEIVYYKKFLFYNYVLFFFDISVAEM